MGLLYIGGLCRDWSIIYRSVPAAFMMEVYFCAVMMGVGWECDGSFMMGFNGL